MTRHGPGALRSRARADGVQLGAYSRIGRLDRLALEMPVAYEWAERNGVLHELQKAFLDADGKWEHWERYTQHGVEQQDESSGRWKSESQAARAAAWMPSRGADAAGSAAPEPAPHAPGLHPPPVDKRRTEARFQMQKVSESPPVSVLSVTESSNLTATHVSRLTQVLGSIEMEMGRGLVMDLSPIEHLDVGVMGLILDRATKMKSHGGELVLVEPQPRCFGALKAIGVPERVRCFATQAMAVDAVVEKLQQG